MSSSDMTPENVRQHKFSNILVGVLVDVSGSMKRNFQEDVTPTDGEITRAEPIFKTIIKIAEDELSDNEKQQMFVLAFGLEQMKTCDLLYLLEKKAEMKRIEKLKQFAKERVKTSALRGIGYEPLIELVAKNGAPFAEEYIRKYMKPDEAEVLYDYYSKNYWELKDVIKDLPWACKYRFVNNIVQFSTSSFRQASDFFAAISFVSSHLVSVENVSERKETLKQIANVLMKIVSQQAERKEAEKKIANVFMKIDIQQAERKEAEKHIANAFKKIDSQKLKSDQEMLLEELKAQMIPKTKTFKSIIDLMHEITDERLNSTAQNAFSIEQIKDLVISIEPYIYGATPMCEALKRGLKVYDSSNCDTKVLFLLTDGEATDGNPVEFAKELHTKNVCVFVCLITPENIQCPRRLFCEVQPNWTKPQKNMFALCSTVQNTHSGMSILLEQGWQLPPDGESRLFLQANNPDVIDEFAKTVRRFAENTDALLNIFGRVSLDQYINTKMAGFKAPEQVGGTCYANAVAAVLHLAMSRIVGRKDGVPEFETLRQELIKAFGENGANTASVLAKWTQKYRLHCEKVDELGAKQALNARRPVVARFKLFDEEWDQFNKFYKETPQGILTRNDLRVTDKPLTNPGGHAVVLIKCDPQGLTLMNSWGNEWADNGFFKVKNRAVLNLEFFDVYWTLNDLYTEEIDSYNESKRNVAEDIVKKLPLSVRNLPFKCPQCSESSSASSFIGHLLEATCPKCRQNFKPTPLGFVLN